MISDPTSLDRLHDIVAPPPAPWWPLAPGWHWLAATLLVLAIYASVLAFIRWQRNRYRREAIAEWHRQIARLDDPGVRGTALGELATLLKRTALSAFPRAEVASLTGPAWLAFLDRTAAMRDFSSETGALLESAAYDESRAAPEPQAARAAAALVRRWLIEHAAKPGGKPC